MGKINEDVAIFLKDRSTNHRYASYDYCYNHFYEFYKNNNIKDIASPENMEFSCLQLMAYLASWGMLRGSSFLLREKCFKFFEGVIKIISEQKPRMWEIDVDSYNNETVKQLLNFKDIIQKEWGKERLLSDTLTTKIMMGVFGNVPAFDQYFKAGLKVNNFNYKNLMKIKDFYEANKKEIDDIIIKTINYNVEKNSSFIYTKAKIIDMYGFTEGIKLANTNKMEELPA